MTYFSKPFLRQHVYLFGVLAFILVGVQIPFVVESQLLSITDGDLIKTANHHDVYIVKIVGSKRFKRLILNPAVFESYTHLSWGNIKTVSRETLDSYVISDVVRREDDTGVWKLFPGGDAGSKRFIANPQEFSSFGCDWDAIYTINAFEYRIYTVESQSPPPCRELAGANPVPPSPAPSSPPLSSPTPSLGPLGLYRAEYWNFPSISGSAPPFPTSLPHYTRNDQTIAFDWGMNSPAPGIQNHDYAVRWKGSIYFPAGTYNVSFTSDDGVRIWIDNKILLDRWYDHGRQRFTKSFNSGGGAYEIRIEYYNNERHGVAILELQ